MKQAQAITASTASQSPATAVPGLWTTRKLLAWMRTHFEEHGVDSPRHVAELLLAHVNGCERLRLYMEVDRPASADELARLRELVRRAAMHEPVQYLVGEGWFYGMPFEVGRATLIPRPSTETLVEHIIRWLKMSAKTNPLIADIGTGTGCIAVALATQVKDARIIATDIVPEAIELAKRNASRHGVSDRIEFRLGDGLAALVGGHVGGRFDVIASNPPYISDAEWDSGEVGRNVKGFEPESALRGGEDGLDVIRPLLAGAAELLAPGGQLVIEIGHAQRDAVLALAEAISAYESPTVLKDHEGLWRVLTATRR